MKIAAAVIAVIAILALAEPFQPPPSNMAAWVPAGPLLYLEARDFSSLLRDWNASVEKRAWLDSANFELFARSHLFGRLVGVWQEFTAAAGFSPDMQALESIAGGHSALALYDIGKLEFLYISAAPSAHAMESLLWQSRAKYESRSAGGSPFYVHADPASGRVVAFAIYRDYVLLGTREELVAGALRLLAGEKPPAVNQDPWFRESVHAAGAPGDLRLVMNLETIVRTPYFRSYWIQRSNAMLKPYWAGIADVRLAPAEIREDRVLLRRAGQAGSPGSPSSASVAALARLIPDDAGLYRAWAAPEVPAVADLIRDKLLEPEVSRSTLSPNAPWVPETANAGNESDFETRIDEPPLADTGSHFGVEPLRSLLARVGILSVLHVQSSRQLADGVFVETPSAITLAASSAWDPDSVRAALEGGANNVEFTARGNLLVLANSADLLKEILNRLDRKPATDDATYIAGFRHSAERANFEKLMTALDHGKPQPTFFSGNIASLSRVLSRVSTESIKVHDNGGSLTQTITYKTLPSGRGSVNEP
jgi:hypothetical protein